MLEHWTRPRTEGDLTRKVCVEGNEPVDELAAAIGRMLGDLSGIIGQVTSSAEQFHEGAAGRFADIAVDSASAAAPLARRADEHDRGAAHPLHPGRTRQG